MTEQQDNLEFQISLYLDGQMTARQARRFEARLQADVLLQQELARYRRLEQHLAAMGQATVESLDYQGQRDDVMAALERKVLLAGQRRRMVFFRPVFATLAAAAVLAVAVSVAVKIFHQPATTPPQHRVVATGPTATMTMERPGGRNHGQMAVAFYRVDGEDQIDPQAPDGSEGELIVITAARPASESNSFFPMLIE